MKKLATPLTEILLAFSLCLGTAPLADAAQTAPAPPQTSSAAVAQHAPPSPFERDLWRGAALIGSGKLDEAAEAFHEVLEKATKAADVYAQAQAHRGLAAILYRKANYPAASGEAELALSRFKSIQDRKGQAIVMGLLGDISYQTGDLAATRDYDRQSIEAYDGLGMLREKAMAMKALAMADAPNRETLCEEALEIGRRIGDKNLQASVLHLQGDTLFGQGEFDGAQEKLHQAAGLYQETGNQVDLARVLTSEGIVQRAHGHPDKSIELYGKALAIQQKNGDRQGAIQSINAMAVAYDRMNQYSMAAELYQRALTMAKETGSPLLVDFELGNLAGSYIDFGKYTEAVRILENLLSKGEDPRLAPYRYLSLSIARFHLGDFQQSVEGAAKSVEGFRAMKESGDLPQALYQKARAEAKVGDGKAALADAGECVRAVEELRKHLVTSDFMKRGFAGITQNAFGFSIELLMRDHQSARALEVAEQARSRAFLDLLASRDVQASPSREQQLASLRKLKDQLEVHGVDPSIRQTDPIPGLVTRGENSGVSELWNQWVNADAGLRSLVSAEPFSMAQLQAAARRLNSTVMSYWVSSDATYVWLVAPGGAVRSARVSVSSHRLQELVSTLWQAAAPAKRGEEAMPDGQTGSKVEAVGSAPQVPTRGGATITQFGAGRKNWRELYRLLIQPVERWLPAQGSLVTIEPHGPLVMLPFAALRDSRGRYFVERYTLHYLPAMALLAFTKNRQSAREGHPSYLLIADPSGARGDRGKPLPALPGARREVSILARLLPRPEVTILEGERATEQRVKELAGQSSVIHFATHGIIRDDQPFDSFLDLAANGTDTLADGHFTAKKIYGLDLHADLVFLSACRSGMGQVTGDGMAGLTRAFLYAGAPSVIATLWDVADEPTYRLVNQFYRLWLGGGDKARSLRFAQLRLLSDLRRGRVRIRTAAGEFALPEDPIFWASFVLQGDP